MRPRTHLWVFSAALLSYAALGIALNLARLYGLHTNLPDLGVFDQTFWLLLHGGRAFGIIGHFSPILYGLLPIYALFPCPETLLVLNALFITSAAIPVYLIARHWQLHPWLAMVWAFSVLVNPFMWGALVFDFHETSVAAPIIGFALYAVATRRRQLLFAMSLLLLLTKEHYGVTVSGLGLLWAILYREWAAGLLLGALGLIASAVIIKLVLPTITGKAFMSSYYEAQSRFTWILDPGNQPAGFLPLLGFSAVSYLIMLLMLYWFLPLCALPWLLAGGEIIFNLLSADEIMRQPFSYHTLTIIPVIGITAMRGGLLLTQRRPKLKMSELAILVLFTNLGLGYLDAPLPLPGAANLWEVRWDALSDPDREDIHQLQQLLPPEKNLSVQGNVGSFFSQRPEVFTFPLILDSDAILLHLVHPYANSKSIFGNPYYGEEFFKTAQDTLQDPQWHVTYWHDDWLLLEKDARDIPVNRQDIQAALDKMETAYQQAGPKPAK